MNLRPRHTPTKAPPCGAEAPDWLRDKLGPEWALRVACQSALFLLTDPDASELDAARVEKLLRDALGVTSHD